MSGTSFTWFCASVEEECAVPEEVAGNVEDFLDLVGHCSYGISVDVDVAVFRALKFGEQELVLIAGVARDSRI
jgi:hypothetical protein